MTKPPASQAQVGDVIKIPGHGDDLWVVEEAKMTGGGIAMFNDPYPDAWHVTARRLLASKQYSPYTPDITFTQNTNCYNNCIEGVVIVGKMYRTFTWEKP